MKRPMVIAGALLTALLGSAHAAPLRTLPGLTSVTFWEVTNSLRGITYPPTDPRLTAVRSDPLGPANQDFEGAATEYYDVFYSDADGNFNADGAYVTVTATFDFGYPAGGGLNIAEVELAFDDGTTEHADRVASFVALGDNAIPPSAGLAADGDRNTWTTLGNTRDQAERLRLTLGFPSSGPTVPEPSSAPLVAAAVALVALRRRGAPGSSGP
ncbi:MAG: PEP-CTERM sorting domain-containing protein [Nitrospirae bacterium]|nr:MAG: PEP-CTERM sorting domain-containing protein [Nitrospirota bacterium]